MSDKISSPLEYLNLANKPIDSADGLVMLLAIRKANMSGYRQNSRCEHTCNYCMKMQIETPLYNKVVAYPFGFNSEENLFSLVTCSGQTEQGYAFGIILEPFHWGIWISMLLCAFHLLATWVLHSSYRNLKSLVETGISLVLGSFGFGYDSLLLKWSENESFSVFFSLMEFSGDFSWKFVSSPVNRVFSCA